MTSILFVCLGNICRSPTAEAVFRKRASEAGLVVRIESAGTSASHIGEAPDPRSVAAGKKRGYDFSKQKSQQVQPSDFERFDYILAMDFNNWAYLMDMKNQILEENPNAIITAPDRFLEYAYGETEIDVPDPYYGGAEGFDHVLNLIEKASDGLIGQIKAGI